MGFTLEEKFHFLVFKTMGMLVLGEWLGSVGATGLAAYVILISALFAWMELNPGRFLHLLKIGGGGDGTGKGDASGARRKKRRKGVYGPPDDDEGRGPGPEP